MSATGAEGGIGGRTIAGFLDALGSDAATPGGGAAAGVAGAIGAALISMVGRLTIGRDFDADIEERMRGIVDRADEARAEFLEMAERDASAFDGVMEAFTMPKDTEEQGSARTTAIRLGYEHAAAVPMEIAHKAVEMMELAEDVTAMGNPRAASDGACAAAQLHAATLSGLFNVEINAAGVKQEEKVRALLDEAASLRARADQLLEDAMTAFQIRVSS